MASSAVKWASLARRQRHGARPRHLRRLWPRARRLRVRQGVGSPPARSRVRGRAIAPRSGAALRTPCCARWSAARSPWSGDRLLEHGVDAASQRSAGLEVLLPSSAATDAFTSDRHRAPRSRSDFVAPARDQSRAPRPVPVAESSAAPRRRFRLDSVRLRTSGGRRSADSRGARVPGQLDVTMARHRSAMIRLRRRTRVPAIATEPCI